MGDGLTQLRKFITDEVTETKTMLLCRRKRSGPPKNSQASNGLAVSNSRNSSGTTSFKKYHGLLRITVLLGIIAPMSLCLANSIAGIFLSIGEYCMGTLKSFTEFRTGFPSVLSDQTSTTRQNHYSWDQRNDGSEGSAG